MKRFPFAPRLTWRCLTAVLALVATCQSVWAANLIGSYDLAAGSYANSISGSGSLGSLSPISTSGTYGFVTSGNVSLLRVWNGPLTAAEIPTAMTIVPEPTTAVLVTVGAAGVVLRRSRRHTRVR